VRYRDDAGSGNIAWRHGAHSDEMLLTTPFGQGIARLVRADDEFTLTTQDGREYRAGDAESLTEQVLGFRLPLRGLADWVRGRAAHAGVNPQNGVNAVHELAIQIARIAQFNNPRRGITVNVDVVEGGTRSNVIAEQARALVDLRIARASDQRMLEAKFRALHPMLPGARLEVRGGINRPPMVRTARVAALFRHAQKLTREIGLDLQESSTGGGSDGNFTAALGVPTLDGLGGVGEGAHSLQENVVVRALPERAALLAGLLASL